jgi:hypothetical protein
VKVDALRIARMLRARGLSLRRIAESDVMMAFLGQRVSEARISQLLHLPERGPQWCRDTDRALRELCGPDISKAFYTDVIFPRLLARLMMEDGRLSQGHYWIEDREVSAFEWTRRNPEMETVVALAAEYDSRLAWWLDIRNRIIRHLFEAGRTRGPAAPHQLAAEKARLAKRFRVGLRQLERLLRDRRSSAGAA